ncbi:ABC transporter permease [Ideonella sp. A 288]|uniref:FtsX-like permease family protein n=1 Tax=Ideonella sp. A 288 TaxID=1962181 RepID=UPI000B4B9B52
MWRRLFPLSLAEWRHHPWRHGVALLAVALGVALAASVQMINHSALAEFSQAVRSANGEPDVVLAATGRDGLDDALLDALSADEQVAAASPVLEIDSHARRVGAAAPAASQPGPVRVGVRVTGIDALQVARLAPALLPRPASGAALTAVLDPGSAWLNPAARARLEARDGDVVELQASDGWHALRVAGSVAAAGGPMVVVDVAAAQQLFGRGGRLTRIDLRLVTGVDRERWLATLALPAGVRVAAADDAVQRVSNLSRAYRVNLGVLALVALLVGGFLVYSVVSLSVAQRTPALALLGVLGLSAGERRAWILAESAVLGAIGSVLGLALGAALAALALRLLGGDLGGGYFPGVAPRLAWPLPALAACGVLGTLSAVAGAWWPARQAERLSPALALKGLGGASARPVPRWPAPALLAGGALLALLPPVAGLPLAAYASVALLLAGGVVAVPLAVQALLAHRSAPQPVLAWLAWRRAGYARQTASATVAGVVASLALSVALTVMVASFREAVTDWLGQVLPADLYARSATSAAAAEQSSLPEGLPAGVAALPGVARVDAARVLPLPIDPRQPAVTLIARALPTPERQLPLLGAALPARDGELGVFVSEPAAALHGWSAGQLIRLPLPGGEQVARVRGVWRDYARQFGSVAMDLGDYQRLTGDRRLNDLSIWLAPGARVEAVREGMTALAGPDHPLESAGTAELRRISLAIFDRSFAVTRYLQAVAIAVGLVGVAASLSAQVLARRKEFGLLAHLGLTRRQTLWLVTLESVAWLAAGCAVGVALGLAIAVVLVHVVNPQSFHWTMPMHLPGWRLAALAGVVLAAGAATAAFSARHAASRQAVLAVKEDW